MPVVPRYDSQVQNQPLPNFRVSTELPAETYGGGQTQQQLTQAGMNLGEHVYKVAEASRKQADQVAVMQADTAMSEYQTNVQVGVSKMQGLSALNAPDYIKEQWKKGVDNISGSLSSDDQRLMFQKMQMNRWEELNKSTQLHVSGQIQQADDNQTKASLDASKNLAVLNAGNDQMVAVQVDRQNIALTHLLDRKGMLHNPDGSVTEYAKNALQYGSSETHRDVVTAKIDAGLTDNAQAYFEANKSMMNANDLMHSQKSLETAQVMSQGNKVVDIVSHKMLRADGTIDAEQAYQYIMGSSDLSDPKKLSVWSYVHARIGELEASRNKDIAANNYEMMNELTKLKSSGGTVQQGMLLALKHGIDSYDTAQKQSVVKQMWEPPKANDANIHVMLDQKARDGELVSQDVQQAFAAGKLTASTYTHLMGEVDKINKGDVSLGDKSKYKISDAMVAKETSDKIEQMQIKSLIRARGQNKSRAEILNITNEELGVDPKTGILGTSYFADKNYKNDIKLKQADDVKIGQYSTILGSSVVRAIGVGQVGEGQAPTASDIQAFAIPFGGVEAIKPGTPVYNAIRSIMNKPGNVVNEEAVASVLKKFPDGNWR